MQSGGLLPITKEASTEVDWTQEECASLLKEIAVPANKSQKSLVRDGIDHSIEINGKETQINVEKAPGKFAVVLDQLKNNLKILKT